MAHRGLFPGERTSPPLGQPALLAGFRDETDEMTVIARLATKDDVGVFAVRQPTD
jgi:hypothetical protein